MPELIFILNPVCHGGATSKHGRTIDCNRSRRNNSLGGIDVAHPRLTLEDRYFSVPGVIGMVKAPTAAVGTTPGAGQTPLIVKTRSQNEDDFSNAAEGISSIICCLRFNGVSDCTVATIGPCFLLIVVVT